jgi:hypothetical protein
LRYLLSKWIQIVTAYATIIFFDHRSLSEMIKFILFSDKSDGQNIEELSATAKRVDWVKLTRETTDYLSKAYFIVKVQFFSGHKKQDIAITEDYRHETPSNRK